MPFRDVSALHAWRESENPPIEVWRAVRDWIGQLSEYPWRAPSVPVESVPPEYEIRLAFLPEAGVEVRYRREFITETVDILSVVGPSQRH